jgi:hypothetical protein
MKRNLQPQFPKLGFNKHTCLVIRFIVVALWLFSYTAAFSQSYRPLLDTTALWHEQWGYGDPGPNTLDRWCVKYFLRGNTTLGSNSYKELLLTGSHRHVNTVNSQLSYTNWYFDALVAYIREDTTIRQVYIRESANWPEQLLYDFSVDLGAYPWTYVLPYEDLEVTLVDTILLSDGPHRRQHLGELFDIIEGIGFTGGLLPHESGFFPDVTQIACHKVDGIDNYTGMIADWGCGCSMSVGIAESGVLPNLLSENPTAGLFVLDSPTPIEVVVHNAQGQFIARAITKEIDLSAHPPGVYTATIGNGMERRSLRLLVIR